MAENSNIEWTDHTFNPWIGCTKVSPACKNCYAERDFDQRYKKVQWGPNGTRRMTSTSNWHQVRRWDREAERAGARMRVFCASLADVFEDWQGPMIGPDGRTVMVAEDGHCTFGEGERVATMQDTRRDLFTLIDDTPNVDWLLLTKRPENVSRFWPVVFDQDANRYGHHGAPHEYYRPNVWIGTSVENQEQADKRIPELLQCRRLSPVLFLSCEPLLGPLNLHRLAEENGFASPGIDGVDWVIAGGESGPNARPSHPDWFRSLRDQCERSGTPFHFKQWGEWYPLHGTGVWSADDEEEQQPFCWIDHEGNATGSGTPPDKIMVRIGKKKAGRLLDGAEHDGVPYSIDVELAPNQCPKCLSKPVQGLVESFWVHLGDDGSMEGQWSDHESSTEVGERRMCPECDHQWEE